MFFGPFLPIVPILFLLELLPESIGGPIQDAILDIALKVLEGANSVVAAISEFIEVIF